MTPQPQARPIPQRRGQRQQRAPWRPLALPLALPPALPSSGPDAQQEDSTVGVPAEAPATEASEDPVVAAEAATGALPPGGLIRFVFGGASSSRSATAGATGESQRAPCPAHTSPPSLLVATPKRGPAEVGTGKACAEQKRRHKCRHARTSTALRAPHRQMLEALFSVLRALPQVQEVNIQLHCGNSRGGPGRQLAFARRGGGGRGRQPQAAQKRIPFPKPRRRTGRRGATSQKSNRRDRGGRVRSADA